MTKDEIAAVLQEIESDLAKAEKEAVASLKKADEGSEPEPEPKEDSSSPAAGGPPDAGGDAGGPPPGPDASAGGPPPDAGAPPAGDPAAAGAPADPAADAGLTPEALQAEYAQLPPEELDMHIQAALGAKEAMAAAAGPAAGGPPGAPPAGPAAGPAGAPPAGPPMGDPAAAGGPPMPPPMGKAALSINKEATGGKITKSDDIAKLTALVKSQQEDIENLTKSIRMVLEAPVRKSVASLSEVGNLKKTEPVAPASRKDVDEFIKTNAHKMTKSERDLWLDFVANKVPAQKLAPMLDRLASSK